MFTGLKRHLFNAEGCVLYETPIKYLQFNISTYLLLLIEIYILTNILYLIGFGEIKMSQNVAAVDCAK